MAFSAFEAAEKAIEALYRGGDRDQPPLLTADNTAPSMVVVPL